VVDTAYVADGLVFVIHSLRVIEALDGSSLTGGSDKELAVRVD
jgi:hypothetical protein